MSRQILAWPPAGSVSPFFSGRPDGFQKVTMSSLVSDLLGVSARCMLKALADGETNPAALAALAHAAPIDGGDADYPDLTALQLFLSEHADHPIAASMVLVP
jgi:hypothetical protein